MSGHVDARKIKTAVITGGAAGNHTVTGISKGLKHYDGDKLISVIEVAVTTGVPTDRTAEFSITADNTINNTGGTDTTNDRLVVIYSDYDAVV